MDGLIVCYVPPVSICWFSWQSECVWLLKGKEWFGYMPVSVCSFICSLFVHLFTHLSDIYPIGELNLTVSH